MPKSPGVLRVPYSSLQFDERAQRYRGANGKFVGPDAVRAIIEDDIKQTGARMQAHGTALKSGAVDVETFRNRMAVEVRSLHLAEVAAANGGIHSMTQADFGRAGERIRYHVERLDGFVQEIQADPKILTGEAAGRKMDFDERLQMYADAGLNTYERARAVSQVEAGFGYCESNLEPTAHHCEGPESCKAMAALGRVPVAKMLMPGDRKCKTKCRCTVEYFRERE